MGDLQGLAVNQPFRDSEWPPEVLEWLKTQPWPEFINNVSSTSGEDGTSVDLAGAPQVRGSENLTQNG